MKRVLALVVTFCLVGNLTAQNNTWEVFLRGQAVKSIAFENNYVWAATDSFLVSFNKLDSSTTYYPYPDIVEDMTSIIKIDNKGVKWIVRSGKPGLDPVNSIYGFDVNEWYKVDFNGEGPFYSLVVDKNNNKWMVSDGFHPHLYKMEEGSCMQYTSDNSGLLYNYVENVASDNNGNIWLANVGNYDEPFSADLALMEYDGNKWTSFYSESRLFCNAMSFDSQGNLWVQQLFTLQKLDIASNSWTEQINLDKTCQLQAIEGEDKLWFRGNDFGIAIYKDSAWSFYTTSNSELPSNTVYQIAIDSNGTKWIGTANGLAAFDKNGLHTSDNPDSKMMKKIALFPNPARDYITIQIAGELQRSTVEIINLQGKVVKSFSLNNNQNQLDVRNLSSGVYLVRIQTGESYTNKKIVKQ